MSIWGKILGGAAGLALGGPLGALVGAAAGHAFDKLASANDDQTRSIAFTIAVIALGAKMAKADGTVTPDEVAAFNEVFRVPPGEAQNVARIFNLARRNAAGFEPYARQVGQMFHDRPAVLEELLLCLIHIAKADGRIDERELAYLRAVAGRLGLDDAAFERLRLAELGPDAADPYRILGVDRGASDEAIKAAYRAMSRENHPDRLVAAGLPPEFAAIANSRMASINGAYDKIRKERARRAPAAT